MLSHKHLCLLDGQPELGNEAFTPMGKSMRLYKGGGGGGGGQVRYDNLDALYGQQAQSAKRLDDVAARTVIPGYEQLIADAKNAGSVEQQNRNAARVGQDFAVMNSLNTKAAERNQQSLGINPASEQFMRATAGNVPAATVAQVGAMNAERNRTRDMGQAMLQDRVGMGMGIPGQAQAAFGAATSGQQGLINQQQQFAMQQQQMQNSALSNAVAGGIAGYGLYKNFTAANGGLMTKDGVKTYADGGFVKRDGAPGYAGGGFIGGGGFMQPTAATPAPMGAAGIEPYKPSTGEKAVIGASAAMQGAGMGKAVGSGLTSLGTALNGGTAAAAGGTAAATGAAAAGGTAAATGAASAGALGTIGTAMPYVGAALLVDQALFGGKGLETVIESSPIGNMLGLDKLFGYADGGEVDSQRVNGLRGGEVDGPGGATDDLIPAWLSDGEFVMTAEAVQHFGLDKLNKMNQVGLAIRNGTHGKSQSKEKAA